MSEDPEFHDREGAPGENATPPEPERVRTGMPSVDEVIVAVEELEDRPVEEHVGVFETAHEQLRRALDAKPMDDRAAGGSGDQPA